MGNDSPEMCIRDSIPHHGINAVILKQPDRFFHIRHVKSPVLPALEQNGGRAGRRFPVLRDDGAGYISGLDVYKRQILYLITPKN